jgi:hypothetical protein
MAEIVGSGSQFYGGHSLHTGGVTGSIPVAPTIISAEKLETSAHQKQPIGINRKLKEPLHVQRCAISVHIFSKLRLF